MLPVIIAPERKKRLNKNLMMFFTGFTRFSLDVQKANAVGKVDKTAQLKEMLALVDEAEKVLVNKERDLDDFGRMLDHTWKLKRQTVAAVSTNSIDELYAKGIAAVLVPWAENCLAQAAVAFLCSMCSRNVRTLFAGQCVISCIFHFSLRMAVHG